MSLLISIETLLAMLMFSKQFCALTPCESRTGADTRQQSQAWARAEPSCKPALSLLSTALPAMAVRKSWTETDLCLFVCLGIMTTGTTQHGNFRIERKECGGSNKTKCKVNELFTAINNCEVTYSGSMHPKWGLQHFSHLPSVLSDFFAIGCMRLG